MPGRASHLCRVLVSSEVGSDSAGNLQAGFGSIFSSPVIAGVLCAGRK